MIECFINQIGWDGTCEPPTHFLPADIDFEFISEISHTTGVKLFQSALNDASDRVKDDILLYSGARQKIYGVQVPELCKLCLSTVDSGVLEYSTNKILKVNFITILSNENKGVEVQLSGVLKGGEDYSETVTINTNTNYPIKKEFTQFKAEHSETLETYGGTALSMCECGCVDKRGGLFIDGDVYCDIDEILCSYNLKELLSLTFSIAILHAAMMSKRITLSAERKDLIAWSISRHEKQYEKRLKRFAEQFKSSLDDKCFICGGVQYTQI